MYKHIHAALRVPYSTHCIVYTLRAGGKTIFESVSLFIYT